MLPTCGFPSTRGRLSHSHSEIRTQESMKCSVQGPTKTYSRTFCINSRLFAFMHSTPSLKKAVITTAVYAVGSSSSNKNSNQGGAYTTLSERATFEREIKKSKFIAIAGPISSEQSAHSFLSAVRDTRATHNCWAYKIEDQYRCNDDGEPSGTAGKPIYSAILSSGIDRVMVVVIRYFGGIKLGTGGLVRAYGRVAAECLMNAPTCLVKSKISMGVEVSFDILGLVYHQLQSFQADDIKQDYETGKDGTTMVTFKVDFDKVESFEDAIRATCGRDIVLYKH